MRPVMRGDRPVRSRRIRTAVEFSVAHDGLERSQSLGPARSFGLLVEVAVEKGGTSVSARGRNVKEKRGRLSRQGQNFKDAFREKLFSPLRSFPERTHQLTVSFPIRVAKAALGRDPNELHEGGKRLLVEKAPVLGEFFRRNHLRMMKA